jgi:hypothetical protein
MSIRKSVFALAALATLGTSALAPTSASAFGFGGHIGGGHFGGHFGGFGHLGGFGHFGGFHFGGFHGIWHGAGLHPGPICSWGCGYPGRYHWWPRFYPRYGYGYRGGAIYGAGVGPSVNYAAPAPAPASAPTSGCLTKQELPDGTALFQDLCTQEQAETQPQGAPQEMPQSTPRRRFLGGS